MARNSQADPAIVLLIVPPRTPIHYLLIAFCRTPPLGFAFRRQEVLIRPHCSTRKSYHLLIWEGTNPFNSIGFELRHNQFMDRVSDRPYQCSCIIFKYTFFKIL
ncbi:UNVERIFIED_CONTAM: hypothetical protein ABIC26_000554 [Paenibacillus sp. PvR008]